MRELSKQSKIIFVLIIKYRKTPRFVLKRLLAYIRVSLVSFFSIKFEK